jgi:hypothetical protein
MPRRGFRFCTQKSTDARGFFRRIGAVSGGFFFPVAGVFPCGGRQIQQLRGRVFRAFFSRIGAGFRFGFRFVSGRFSLPGMALSGLPKPPAWRPAAGQERALARPAGVHS